MIISANVAVNNVIKHNEEFPKLIKKVCSEIERAAYEESYATTVVVDSEDEDMIDSVVKFLKNELGYKVAVSHYNVLHISWYELDVKHMKRDDYLTAEVVYLTAEAACTIVREYSKSYDKVCADINELIENSSKNGKGYCFYNVNNVSHSVIKEVKESLLNAGYDIGLYDDNLTIKWIE